MNAIGDQQVRISVEHMVERFDCGSYARGKIRWYGFAVVQNNAQDTRAITAPLPLMGGAQREMLAQDAHIIPITDQPLDFETKCFVRMNAEPNALGETLSGAHLRGGNVDLPAILARITDSRIAQ